MSNDPRPTGNRRIPLLASTLAGLLLFGHRPGRRAVALLEGRRRGAKITPETNMWMAGYAARTKPAEGVELDLYAKALVVEDQAGTRWALVTMDLIGVPRNVRLFVAERAEKQFGIDARTPRAECLSHPQRPGVAHRAHARDRRSRQARRRGHRLHGDAPGHAHAAHRRGRREGRARDAGIRPRTLRIRHEPPHAQRQGRLGQLPESRRAGGSVRAGAPRGGRRWEGGGVRVRLQLPLHHAGAPEVQRRLRGLRPAVSGGGPPRSGRHVHERMQRRSEPVSEVHDGTRPDPRPLARHRRRGRLDDEAQAAGRAHPRRLPGDPARLRHAAHARRAHRAREVRQQAGGGPRRSHPGSPG